MSLHPRFERTQLTIGMGASEPAALVDNAPVPHRGWPCGCQSLILRSIPTSRFQPAPVPRRLRCEPAASRRTILYHLVEEHRETFLAQVELETGQPSVAYADS
jgi:hypothetical protein